MSLFEISSSRPQASAVQVMAAAEWPSNAHLIVDVARIGYLNATDAVVDVTFGKGNFWSLWSPDDLTAHDIDPAKGDGVDFKALPEADDTYDAGVIDPPYMAPGGRDKSTIDAFNDAYGLHTTPATPALNQESINAGVSELGRVVKPGGIVLVKCMDYVNGGALFPGTHHTLTHAIAAGFKYVDRFDHIRRPGAQALTNRDGSPRRQVHARRNLSTLLVLRGPRPSAKRGAGR